uniref:ATP synthase F0 subunit 8 n=1 Tax=Euwallacea interjectus TaxID=321055 RepID=UPI0022A7643C|nr:ATP synthase F0 subunit 8 [Euwallacea interjectus]UZT26976.1 ATP synthase F0 subunit 8 [Euwallacea interjectus]WEP25213.1 ATP synthase F0 subunit 8 [Euwallacea interjectus]
MPQMAPLSWTFMFIFFSILFMLNCIINFYNFSYPIMKKNKNKISFVLNWKW